MPLFEEQKRIHTFIINRSKALELYSNYSPMEVVTQLMILDFSMLKNITEEELCNMGWDRKDDTKSANVNAMVDRWNKVSNWVSSEIICATDKNDRRKLIKWFISISEKLYEIRNYHTMMAIVAGLNNLYVARIYEMKSLGNKTRQRKQHLETLMSTENNWANYRERLKKSDGLVVPYLGICMKDIYVVLDDKHQTQIGRYNWAKLRILQQVLAQFFRFRNQDCLFEKNPELIKSLCYLFIRTEHELDELTSSNKQ